MKKYCTCDFETQRRATYRFYGKVHVLPDTWFGVNLRPTFEHSAHNLALASSLCSVSPSAHCTCLVLLLTLAASAGVTSLTSTAGLYPSQPR